MQNFSKRIEEAAILVMEANCLSERKQPIPKSWVEYNPEHGDYWRTIGGQKILFHKGGRAVNSPKWMGGSEPDKDRGDSAKKTGMKEGPITKDQDKKIKKHQKHIDKIMKGKKHGFEAGLDKDGEPVITNSEVEEAAEQDENVDSGDLAVRITGEKIWDVATALTGLVNTYAAVIMSAGKGLTSVLEKSITNLRDALEDWQK